MLCVQPSWCDHAGDGTHRRLDDREPPLPAPLAVAGAQSRSAPVSMHSWRDSHDHPSCTLAAPTLTNSCANASSGFPPPVEHVPATGCPIGIRRNQEHGACAASGVSTGVDTSASDAATADSLRSATEASPVAIMPHVRLEQTAVRGCGTHAGPASSTQASGCIHGHPEPRRASWWGADCSARACSTVTAAGLGAADSEAAGDMSEAGWQHAQHTQHARPGTRPSSHGSPAYTAAEMYSIYSTPSGAGPSLHDGEAARLAGGHAAPAEHPAFACGSGTAIHHDLRGAAACLRGRPHSCVPLLSCVPHVCRMSPTDGTFTTFAFTCTCTHMKWNSEHGINTPAVPAVVSSRPPHQAHRTL